MVKLETELVTNDLIVDVIKSEQQLKRIRDSAFPASPGYPTLDGLDSTINTPRTCVFSDEDNTRSYKIREFSNFNVSLNDMWKLPPIGSSLASPSSLQIGKSAPVGLSFQTDGKLDSSNQFGMFLPYASPVDSESEEWAHSRMSSGYSIETDLTIELWHRGF
ncbi:hypothetical protein PtA15_7A74 [Puccinia triticina]|nr:uncharacterized protein PtA15_7A74 [Puccinia triticina]WAQ86348.1 hypothetical protein PtA15_7A74 [Puccinia triticina]WAR56226.1 hypothetical protein PtB15_7B71 [Puccinia triticina]